jgi:hypothetical protein
VAHEARVDERPEGVEMGLGELLGRLERGAAPKDGEPREEALLVGGQQLLAPLDRGPEGLLAGVRVSSASQQVEALREPFEDLFR